MKKKPVRKPKISLHGNTGDDDLFIVLNKLVMH
jgi:hypothetical protein